MPPPGLNRVKWDLGTNYLICFENKYFKRTTFHGREYHCYKLLINITTFRKEEPIHQDTVQNTYK